MTGHRTTIFSTVQFLRGVILVSSFFLVILGMRNPMLGNSATPKQRPRAVLEEVTKASDSLVEDNIVTAEANALLVHDSASPSITYPVTIPFEISSKFTAPRLAARAPPVVVPL